MKHRRHIPNVHYHHQQQEHHYQHYHTNNNNNGRSWHGLPLLVLTDRRLLQVLLFVAAIFGTNLWFLWKSHHQILFLLPTDGAGAGLPLIKSIQEATQQDQKKNTTTIPPTFIDKVDYDSIFCRNNNNFIHGNATTTTSTATTTINIPRPPVFLWGIPSTTSDHEIKRRDLLRWTYLNFFRDARIKQSATANSTAVYHPDRICSLHEYTCQHARYMDHCHIVYVFFVGGGDPTTAPPERLDESLTDFRTMLVPTNRIPKMKTVADNVTTAATTANSSTASSTPIQSHPTTTTSTVVDYDWIAANLHEPGVVYLDIRENQFDGKMTTWFQFAALVAREYPSLDYAAKVDSDLLLFPPNFLQYMQEEHIDAFKSSSSSSPVVQRTYGGVEFPATNCVVNMTKDHPCPLPLAGPSYMSGELNFMTMDLATYIVSNDCPRTKWTIPHEDVSLSNYVYSYVDNAQYHARQQKQQKQDDNNNNNTIDQHYSIHIVSVNTSRILLTSTMTADWETIQVQKDPAAFDRLLWGHSIKRGKYTKFLVFKKDRTFRTMWERFVRSRVGLSSYYRNGGGGGGGTLQLNETMTSDRRQQLMERLRLQRQNHGNVPPKT
jgi:Galactosyltransferase